MHARFYTPDDLAPGAVIDLPDEESQHATRVLRLGVGDAVRVFDGRGHEFSAFIVSTGKTGVRLELGSATRPAAEPRVAVTLVQAVLKGDKMDDVVRDAVMLGVAAIQPVVTERSEVSLVALERGARRERWQRVAIASTKQCGRAVVPPIASPALLWRSIVAVPGAITVMCVEPGLPAGGLSIASLPQAAPEVVRLVIGPEGGWAPGEVTRGAATAVLVTLGDRTLRADATALVALTALYARWGDL
jgi:16S rRNA (uracil1498-N3)-methyltransferase